MLLIDATHDHTRAHMVCARSARFYRVGEVLQGRRGFYRVGEVFTGSARFLCSARGHFYDQRRKIVCLWNKRLSRKMLIKVKAVKLCWKSSFVFILSKKCFATQTPFALVNLPYTVRPCTGISTEVFAHDKLSARPPHIHVNHALAQVQLVDRWSTHRPTSAFTSATTRARPGARRSRNVTFSSWPTTAQWSWPCRWYSWGLFRFCSEFGRRAIRANLSANVSCSAWFATNRW